MLNENQKALFDSVEDMKERAKLFAVFAHANQMYGGKPYLVHLAAVANTLERFGYDSGKMIAAAYLHDVVEDTGYTHEDILGLFGPTVADIVTAVTNEPGVNRKERSLKTYPKIRANKLAVMVKLADRIANIENCIVTDNDRLDMYRKEHAAFKEALQDSYMYVNMWKWLDFLVR